MPCRSRAHAWYSSTEPAKPVAMVASSFAISASTTGRCSGRTDIWSADPTFVSTHLRLSQTVPSGSPSGGGRTGFSFGNWRVCPAGVLIMPSADLGGHDDKQDDRDHRRTEGDHARHRVLAHRENEAADQRLRALLRRPERSGQHYSPACRPPRASH